MYATSIPVTADSFFDQEDEIARLQELVHKLRAGSPAWLAMVGLRKIGKTSLLLELSRRVPPPGSGWRRRASVSIDPRQEVVDRR